MPTNLKINRMIRCQFFGSIQTGNLQFIMVLGPEGFNPSGCWWKTIKTFNISDSGTQLNVKELKSGVYILRIENAENVVIKRLVIQ